MLRISRTLRGAIAAAVATGTMLVLPGAAMAVPNWALSNLTSSGPYTSGELATYTLDIVNTGTAPAMPGTISLTETGMDVTVVGTPTVADGPTAGDFDAADVTVADGSNDVTVNTTLGTNEDVTVTFQVRLPSAYNSSWQVQASGIVDTVSFLETDAAREVSKGSGSILEASFPADAAKLVSKDGTFTTTVNVKNTGSGAAEFTRSSVNVFGNASPFSPDWTGHPAFTPVATLTGCTLEGSECLLGTIAPGETKSYTVTITAITHFGSLFLSTNADDASSETDSGFHSVQVTNGKTATARVNVEGPETAPGNSDVTYTGEFVNAGPDALEQAVLNIGASAFNTDGKEFWMFAGTEVESIKSIALSNGATCAPEVNNYVTPAVARKNAWDCSLSNIAPGQRVTFTVVASFPTALKDQNGTISASLESPVFFTDDSSSADSAFTSLNVDKTVDLETTMTSQAVIGTDRLASVTVAVKNNGNTKAERVSISGDIRGGAFDKDTMPATCTGVAKPMYASCSLGSIEPGQTATVVIPVRGGTTLGTVVVTFNASHFNPNGGTETNSDNNSSVLVMQLVKADAVPFENVTVAKPAKQTLAQVVKSGVPATVTCPNACRVVGELQVNRGQAQKLGLIKAPRKGTRRAKALPYIVIGKSVKTADAAGKVTLSIKLTKAYKAKVAKLTKPLTVARVLTVTSTDAATKDASFQTSQAIALKPAKKPRKTRR